MSAPVARAGPRAPETPAVVLVLVLVLVVATHDTGGSSTRPLKLVDPPLPNGSIVISVPYQ
eukprot:CAMPEP_0195103690 /NCGR_PEP_ID=MMETSP0448-20130528/72661_2 /TAXON_ID=66468 /ORGANISM="Heterocapsa triquestra, Strain CCMP 448" /LENGTH=60 /DNA_ID=CAMNT_0040139413 /DNA_START=148 /DNA_END=327 /DNA_ORIENTATION=-